MTLKATRAAVILVWLAVTVVYAWWCVVTTTPPEGFDRVADNVLLVFAMVRLPFFLVGLGLALWWVGRRRRA